MSHESQPHESQERYGIRKARQGGWEVFDVVTCYTVVLDGIEQTGLDIRDADEVAEDLDAVARRAAGSDAAKPH